MPRSLVTLGPRHHAAIRLKLNGASGDEIARTVGVTRRTVYLWMGDPLMKCELERQLERVNDELAQRIAAASLTALNELVWLVELPVSRNPTPGEKLAVANEILNRYKRLRDEQEGHMIARTLTSLQATPR